MMKRKFAIVLFCFFCSLIVIQGCAGTQQKTYTTGRRPIEALPNEVAADTLTVRDFRNVC